jgi:hypothetical protein
MIPTAELQSRQLRRLFSYASVLLIVVLLTLGCTPDGLSPASGYKERAFAAMIEIPIEPKVRLLTDKDRYRPDEYIGIKVDNQTPNVLWFTDQDLGLRVYQYDEQSGTWHSVDLSSKLGNPEVTSIEPGPADPLPTAVIPVAGIQASGGLRLVITGVTDQGRMFIAYKEIEIID